MKEFTAIVGALESLATILALFFGGLWTYRLFVKHRKGDPSLQIAINPTVVDLPSGHQLILVEVVLRNIGSVMVSLEEAKLHLFQILPLPSDRIQLVQEGNDITYKGEREVEWTTLASREWQWLSGELELEPQEEEFLSAEFVVAPEIDLAKLYCYAENQSKKPRTIGWTRAILIPTQETQEEDMSKTHMTDRQPKVVKAVDTGKDLQKAQQKCVTTKPQTQPQKEKT